MLTKVIGFGAGFVVSSLAILRSFQYQLLLYQCSQYLFLEHFLAVQAGLFSSDKYSQVLNPNFTDETVELNTL